MDLQRIFSSVLSMTVTGSIVILCVLAARLVLRKAPKVFSWMLWLVVLLRLLCPVSVPGPVSVLEFVDVPRTEAGAPEYPAPPVQSPLETSPAAGMGQAVQPAPTPSEPPVDWKLLGSRVWLGGVLVLAGYGFISYVNLKRRLRESVPVGRGIREADGIASPFVLGRTIYLPAGLGGERGCILLHEQCHLRHGDPIVKCLFWLAVCIHWFNPLVWLGFVLCGRDMELRCDEAVLKQLGGSIRSDYAQSLLDLAAGRRFAPAPLAFGQGDTGQRVKFVLTWKKTKRWIAFPAAVLCAAVLVLTGCDPAKAPALSDGPFGHSYRATMFLTSTQHDEPVKQNRLFTLTSDMALFIRNDGETAMYGSFKALEALPDTCAACPNREEWARIKAESVGAWEALQNGPDNYLLIQMMDGMLYLIQGDQMYQLERTDLLGVTIRQPGLEAYVEPVWFSTDSWTWMSEELSTTLVESDAVIVLMPEQEVDMLLVSEEYYEAQPEGESTIITSDYLLERDENGEFSLNVTRRGKVGDDFALYRVTVGEDHFVFRLAFPAVPGETSVGVHVPQQWREVRYAEHGVHITLQLPESWSYAVTSIDAEEPDAGIAGGITFWPLGREEGKLFFGYYPDHFAVCGTGLETKEQILAGRKATVGTYDGGELWSFISFGEYFAVWGQGHEAWWAEYGDTAMEILNSAEFGNMLIGLTQHPPSRPPAFMRGVPGGRGESYRGSYSPKC